MFNLLDKFFNKKYKADAVCYALEGDVQSNLGQYKEAISYFNKAIAIEPDNDMYFMSRAAAKYRNKKYSEALKDIEKAIDLNENIHKYHIFKALIKLQSQNANDILKDFNLLLTKFENSCNSTVIELLSEVEEILNKISNSEEKSDLLDRISKLRQSIF